MRKIFTFFLALVASVGTMMAAKDGAAFPEDLGVADISRITATINGAAPLGIEGVSAGEPMVLLKALFTIADPSGIDHTNVQSPTSNGKLIKDGQLFILRNGELFNAQGVRVK